MGAGLPEFICLSGRGTGSGGAAAGAGAGGGTHRSGAAGTERATDVPPADASAAWGPHGPSTSHNRFVLDCKDKEPDVLFVGDSMVQLMQQYEIWRELFSPLHALNFGIGGDTTRHVLWRLKNGELENIKPKVIVVWVGTNNHENTAEEVAGGIEAIVKLINTRQPQAKIIVLGLLPRGEKPNPLRQKNAKVNQLLKVSLPKLANVQLLDADGGFVHSDGAISCHDMFDFLHLTGGGYAKICKPLHELIMQLLEETPEEKHTTIA
uniref:Platelet-activating factor acetylhydrolase IB subunit alpha2 n=1 Tax=Callithrix jacchus TaxID=9483 RepID=A0A8I4A445_CALJA